MANDSLLSIFRRGSRTYFYSSVFFTPEVRNEVSSLYAFVRTADDFVDSTPQDADGFYSLRERYFAAAGGEETGDLVVDSFASLSKKRGFEKGWISAFLNSMEMDLTARTYSTLRDVEEYMHGSAETIGLMMSSIMRLPPESHEPAKSLGKAMQYINFIRDIPEDQKLGRCYFPQEDLEEAGLDGLSHEEARARKTHFTKFVRNQVERYGLWQREAEKGYSFIPSRYLVPIKTASDMYGWTAEQIYRDPFVVFRRKVKPSMARIMLQAGKNALALWTRGR